MDHDLVAVCDICLNAVARRRRPRGRRRLADRRQRARCAHAGTDLFALFATTPDTEPVPGSSCVTGRAWQCGVPLERPGGLNGGGARLLGGFTAGHKQAGTAGVDERMRVPLTRDAVTEWFGSDAVVHVAGADRLPPVLAHGASRAFLTEVGLPSCVPHFEITDAEAFADGCFAEQGAERILRVPPGSCGSARLGVTFLVVDGATGVVSLTDKRSSYPDRYLGTVCDTSLLVSDLSAFVPRFACAVPDKAEAARGPAA